MGNKSHREGEMRTSWSVVTTTVSQDAKLLVRGVKSEPMILKKQDRKKICGRVKVKPVWKVVKAWNYQRDSICRMLTSVSSWISTKSDWFQSILRVVVKQSKYEPVDQQWQSRAIKFDAAGDVDVLCVFFSCYYIHCFLLRGFRHDRSTHLHLHRGWRWWWWWWLRLINFCVIKRK